MTITPLRSPGSIHRTTTPEHGRRPDLRDVRDVRALTNPDTFTKASAEPKRTTTQAKRSAWVQSPTRGIDAIDARLRKSGFNGTVLVAKNGKVLMERGYGLANRTTGVKNGADTLYDVGSVTKQFTAAALLKLQEQGKLSLDDPISKYFEVPAARRDITLRQLLQHRSGLGYPSESALANTNPDDPKSFLEAFLAKAPTIGKPGERYEYSNLGYNVLANVVEQASGRSYEDYVKRNLFGPAKMTSSGFNEPGSVDPQRAATGYENRNEEALPAGELPNSWGYKGATGVVTSARDMLRWAEALKDNRVLSKASTQELFATAGDRSGYALGWEVQRDAKGNITSVGHGGSTIGFASNFTIDPRSGMVFVTLSNDEAGSERAIGIPEEEWAKYARRLDDLGRPSTWPSLGK
ncbi:MAG: serine hydrolase domain-containing protein [Deltaproteobacteria bacterium]|jgi:D-alanyl-D-alanine carboxypeptidase